MCRSRRLSKPIAIHQVHTLASIHIVRVILRAVCTIELGGINGGSMNIQDVFVALSLLPLMQIFEAAHSIFIHPASTCLIYQLLHVSDKRTATCRSDQLLALIFLKKALGQHFNAFVLLVGHLLKFFLIISQHSTKSIYNSSNEIY